MVTCFCGVSSKTVFLIGATGYIGGTVLQRLLELPQPPSTITLLVRKQDKADGLTKVPTPNGTKIQTVIGGLSDHEILRKNAAEADITISAADADDVLAIKAVIAGLKDRREKTGHRPLLIHTSGTGTLVDDAKGEYANDKIYTDYAPTPATRTEPALLAINTLPDTAWHRPVDLEIIAADAAGYCKSYIILPSTIWGEATGPLFKDGISNSFSQQLPGMAKIALDRGTPGVVGKGANIWGHVNINDLGDLYTLVYNGALEGDISHGKEGYYFGSTGEYTILSAAEAIGSALVSNKLGENSQPTTLNKDELEKYYGGQYYMGTNSRCRAVRSKSIGWKPKYTEQSDLLRDLKKEVVRIEKTFGKTWKA